MRPVERPESGAYCRNRGLVGGGTAVRAARRVGRLTARVRALVSKQGRRRMSAVQAGYGRSHAPRRSRYRGYVVISHTPIPPGCHISITPIPPSWFVRSIKVCFYERIPQYRRYSYTQTQIPAYYLSDIWIRRYGYGGVDRQAVERAQRPPPLPATLPSPRRLRRGPSRCRSEQHRRRHDRVVAPKSESTQPTVSASQQFGGS